MYATMEEQWFIWIKLKLDQIKFHHIKKEVVAFFTDVTDFDNEHKCTSVHPNSNYYCQLNAKCAFLRDKKLYYYCIYIYMGMYKYNMGGGVIVYGMVDYHMCTWGGGEHEEKVGNHCPKACGGFGGGNLEWMGGIPKPTLSHVGF